MDIIIISGFLIIVVLPKLEHTVLPQQFISRIPNHQEQLVTFWSTEFCSMIMHFADALAVFLLPDDLGLML